jgi:predicted amidohydrolase
MASSLMPSINRRRLLQVSGLSVAVASFGGVPTRAAIGSSLRTTTAGSHGPMPERVRVAAVQSHVGGDIQDNLSAMLAAIDRIQSQPEAKDLIVFHALALSGIMPRSLDDAQRVAIDMIGPEIAALAAKSQQYRLHLAFSALTTDADWPRQVMARHILLGPDGDLLLAACQATHDESLPFLTSIERVLERYVDLYGADAVFPVASTGIGHIAMTSARAAPEVHRALALKGAEIVIRMAADPAPRRDVQACAAHNQCIAIAPVAEVALPAAPDEDMRGSNVGGSIIVGPSGEILAEAGSAWDQTLSATLPIAYYRSIHRLPDIHTALVLPVYTQPQTLV